MALNDRAIKNAKPKDKAYKLSDRDGLYLLGNPGGSKLWPADYTYADKRRTLALGKYPQSAAPYVAPCAAHPHLTRNDATSTWQQRENGYPS